MTTHTEVADHEHLPGDGCETVDHEDHVDHVHGAERHPEAEVHAGHREAHSAGDGCEIVQHGDHEDHLHDGHRHFQHGDHVHEH
ncbi:hypothetical protein ACIBL3_35050 [Kribbella sp. NPDC050124]|uniref:hypothetical protein n=1 Tax=Kribbella sp. NPDC050124 TaxID=3364114 RepID=UPI0037BD0EED